MVRTIVIPENDQIKLDIRQEYIGKEIEVTFLSLEELGVKKPKKTMADLWGVLSDETAEKMREHVIKSRAEWERDI